MRDKIVIVARKLSFCCKIVNTHYFLNVFEKGTETTKHLFSIYSILDKNTVFYILGGGLWRIYQIK